MQSQGYLEERGRRNRAGTEVTETKGGVILEGVMNKGVHMVPEARKGKALYLSLEASEEPAIPSGTLI